MAKKTTTETRELPKFFVRADLSKGSYDAAKRTFDVVWSVGAPGPRYDWNTGTTFIEELSMDPAHVRMARLQSGNSPFLDNHDQYAGADGVVGVVESASLKDGAGIATIRHADTPDVANTVRKIADGIIKNISVGYAVYRYERQPMAEGETVPTWLAVDWEPMEISCVPVGFDENAVVRGKSKSNVTPCVFVTETEEVVNQTEPKEVRNMPPETTTTTPAPTATATPAASAAPAVNVEAERAAAAVLATTAEKNRQNQIRSMQVAHSLPVEFVQPMIDGDTTIEAARSAVLDELAKRSAALVTKPGVVATGGAPSNLQARMKGMEEIILHRANPGQVKINEGSRDFVGMSLLELARGLLEAGGNSTRGMSKMELVTRAFHSTSDFPNLLANVANKTLRKGYDESPRTFVPWAKQATLPDFKQVSRTILGEAPNLSQVLEDGEIKRGTIGDGAEKYQLATYAKILGISRQVIINDDLSAFTQIPQRFGNAAARLESDIVYGILTANAALSDGTALFAATANRNNNLKSSGGSAPSVTSLGLARKIMRTQKGLNGDDFLNIAMKYLIAPAALETVIDQLMANIVPNQTSSVVPMAIKSLIPIIEPRLDGTSTTAWYGAADNSQVDTVEYGYLEGQEGVYTEIRQGFDVDGMEVKARLDFAAKAIDYRGLYQDAGA